MLIWCFFLFILILYGMLLLNNISTKYASLLIHNLNQFVFFNDAVNQCGLFMPLQPSCLTVSCKIKTCCVGGLHNSQKKKKQKTKQKNPSTSTY